MAENTDPLDDTVTALDAALNASNAVQTYTINPNAQSATRFDPMTLLNARREARRQSRGGYAATARTMFDR